MDEYGNKAATAGVVGQEQVAYWSAQIASAKKREEKYRQKAKRALEIYQLEEKDVEDHPQTAFNILFSNTETLLPALYNEVPRPVVSRRYKDDNPIAKVASQALERGISYVIDNPTSGYESLHPMLENAVLSALVPGRGVTRFKYDAEIEDYEDVQVDTADDDALADGDLDGQTPDAGESAIGTQAPRGSISSSSTTAPDVAGLPVAPTVKNETICSEVVQWDKILYGFARRWDQVPWVAFEWNMTEKDVEKSFGKKWAEKLTYSQASEDGTPEKTTEDKRPEHTARVWEIWHKSAKEVVFYAECYTEGLVKRLDDPLKLSGFYPIPEPLSTFLRVEGLTPVPIYDTYKRQARELNRLTVRIEKITEAIKVRGIYDNSIGAIAQVLNANDNQLIPAHGVSGLQQGQTLEKSIWLMPLEQLAAVLQQLMQQREAVKQVIYEITGISDILRGSSVPSETATAQNIKNQWGTLRLKKLQKRVQRYVRDCFRIIAELMAEHFSEDTFAKMTGLPVLGTQEKVQMEQQFQALQAQQQQMQQQQPPQSGGTVPGSSQGPPPGAGEASSAAGQPPAPPDPLQQQVQQLQAELAKPSWGEILALLKDELLRGYSIEVETDSTVDPEAVEDRQQMGEVLQAFGQSMGQLLPFAQQNVLPMPVLKAMLKDIVKKFRFSSSVEDAVEAMPNQLPPQPEPEGIQIAKIKAQADQQKGGESPELIQAKSSAELEKINAEKELAQEKVKLEREKLEIEREKLQLERQRLMIEKENFSIEAQGMREQARAKQELQMVTNQGKIQAARAKAQAAMMQPQQPQQPMGGPPLAPV